LAKPVEGFEAAIASEVKLDARTRSVGFALTFE
jgi:hypothetical protein